MTISSQTRKAGPYIGAGTTSTFPFAFKVFQASDVLVVEVNTTTGIETTMALATNYTVSLNADQDNSPGGSITLTGGALATGTNLIISSQVPYTQGTDITNMGGFYPNIIEDALDKLTIEVQQMREQQGRSLAFPITDPSTSTGTMPSAFERAGTYLGFDANGNPVVAVSLPSYLYLGAKASDPTTRNDSSPLQAGDMYFNTAQSRTKVYSGSAWIDVGVPIPVTVTTQNFSGTGSATAFTLLTEPGFPGAIDVYISGVNQKLTTDYTVSGTTLTFTTAPPSGTNNIYVKILSSYAGGVPNNGSVTPAKLSSGGPVWTTDGDVGIGISSPDHYAGYKTLTIGSTGANDSLINLRGKDANNLFELYAGSNGGGSFENGIAAYGTSGSWYLYGGYYETGELAYTVLQSAVKPILFITDVERLRITADGNVFIGATTMPPVWTGYESARTLYVNNPDINGYCLLDLQCGEMEGQIYTADNGDGTGCLAIECYPAGGSSYKTVYVTGDPLRLGTTKIGSFNYVDAITIEAGANIKRGIAGSNSGTMYPDFCARAWVNFNGTGTVAIRASGNVSSITDNGTGDYTVNLTTAMPDANYSAVGTSSKSDGSAGNTNVGIGSYSSSSFRVNIYSTVNVLEDSASVSCAVFR